MSIEKIIKESMERNPVDMKEALKEELQSRVAAVLEAKMKKKNEDDDEDEDQDDEDDDQDDEDDDDEEEELDEAKKSKGEFYADEEDGDWHVFNTETSKSYASYSSKEAAEKEAAKMNKNH